MNFFVFLCLLICGNLAQNKNNVQDFRMMTWNSEGAKWDYVEFLMSININIEIFALQEAGTTRNRFSNPTQPSDPNRPTFCTLGDDGVAVYPGGVQEYIWTSGNRPTNYYVYCYIRNRLDDGSRDPTSTSKQNICIISRYRATTVLILPPQSNEPEPSTAADALNQQRIYQNRPVIGIQINHAFFFTAHPEPNHRNELPIQLAILSRHMARFHPQATWILMGDFNRNPQEIPQMQNQFTIAPTQHTHIPRDPNHRSDILDFAIIGGNIFYSTILSAIHASVIANNPNRHGSDHLPVLIN